MSKFFPESLLGLELEDLFLSQEFASLVSVDIPQDDVSQGSRGIQ